MAWTRAQVLAALQAAMKQRRSHKQRVRLMEQRYLERATVNAKLALMMAQERSRGSKVRARRLHQEWRAHGPRFEVSREGRVIEVIPARFRAGDVVRLRDVPGVPETWSS